MARRRSSRPARRTARRSGTGSRLAALLLALVLLAAISAAAPVPSGVVGLAAVIMCLAALVITPTRRRRIR